MDKKDLLKLKEQIENAKTESAQLRGKLEYMIDQLKKEWKCETVDQAEELLGKIDGEITELKTLIKKSIAELEEQYDG